MKLAEGYGLYLGYLSLLVEIQDEGVRYAIIDTVPENNGITICEDGYGVCPFTLARTIWDM